MTTFTTAFENKANEAYTFNGGKTHASTLNRNLDFFFVGGASRTMPEEKIREMFDNAMRENESTAFRILLWLRDCRGGAGERRAFRILLPVALNHLENRYGFKAVKSFLAKIPELGRWDDMWDNDMLSSLSARTTEIVARLVDNALKNENGLCAKWLDRKGPNASFFRKHMGMSPREYRKTLVRLTKVVEQDMCAKRFDRINYSHVPSVAFSRYRKAFERNDPERFAKFVDNAEQGKEKVSAQVVFPHDVFRGDYNSSAQQKAVEAQWKNLPTFDALKNSRILPVADVSGSMTWSSISGSVRPIDISVALSLYFATKQDGPFAEKVVTFSDYPEFVSFAKTDSIVTKKTLVERMDWGGSTNINGVFELILKTALENECSQTDLPDTILIFSDMEFNSCQHETPAYNVWKKKFAEHGYALPLIVFWNLNGRDGNFPVCKTTANTALISGYSQNVLEAVLNGNLTNITPLGIMSETIGKDRYSIEVL